MRRIFSKRTGLALVVLIAAGFLFYWYEWSPTKIRQACAAEAEHQAKNATTKLTPTGMNGLYSHCLHRNGLAD